MNLTPRQCPQCGSGFKVLLNQQYRLFCSISCRKRYYKEHPKEKDLNPSAQFERPWVAPDSADILDEVY